MIYPTRFAPPGTFRDWVTMAEFGIWNLCGGPKSVQNQHICLDVLSKKVLFVWFLGFPKEILIVLSFSFFISMRDVIYCTVFKS